MLTYLLIALIAPLFFIVKSACHAYYAITFMNAHEHDKAMQSFIAFMFSLFAIALVFSIAYLKTKAHV